MQPIFKSEFTRYRNLAIAFGALLLTFYILMPMVTSRTLLDSEVMLEILSYLLLPLASFAFGLLQMMLHRRKNHWTFLIHRPIQSQSIFTAIALAGAAAILCVVTLPLLLTITGYDLLTYRVVDTRHYLYVISVTLICFVTYLIGTLTVINRGHGVFLMLISLVLFIVPKPYNYVAQFSPLLLILAALIFVNVVSFKPDLSQQVKNPLAIGLMSVGTSFALVLVLILSTAIYYHIPLFLMGSHPDVKPPAGSYSQFWHHSFNERIGFAMGDSNHPQKEHYINQAKLADLDYINVDKRTFPRKGQMHAKDRQSSFYNVGTDVLWEFSHDQMVLQGHYRTKQVPAGFIGKNGFVAEKGSLTDADRFDEVPYLVGNSLLSTTRHIYHINFDDLTILTKHSVGDGERYMSKLQLREQGAYVVTNSHALLFDINDMRDAYTSVEPEYRVPHPKPMENLRNAFLYRIADGYLILYMGENFHGFDQPGARVVMAKLDGETDVIADWSASAYDYPVWIRYFEVVISPALFVASELLFHAIEPSEQDNLSWQQIQNLSFPKSAYYLAAIIHVMSLLLMMFIVRYYNQPRQLRVIWLLLVAFLSLPALCSYFVLNPLRRERVVTKKSNVKGVTQLSMV